jgi:uncharacterized membrane protein (DUF2068 family)
MRMMTGAILILASVVLVATYGYVNSMEAAGIVKIPDWLKWYAYAVGAIGWAFMVWGLVKDLRATRYHSRSRHKGDA